MEKFMFETEETALFKDVYEHLQDEKSREIYCTRSLFSLTDDRLYMKKIIREMVLSEIMCKEISNHSDKKLVLFGAGTWGKAITEFFPEINWDYIIDNKRAGEKLNGFNIVSFEEFLNRKEDSYIVIAVLFKYLEVEKQLLDEGISSQCYISLGRIAEEKQYFDLPELKFLQDEIFVDIGAYNGNTSLNFAKVTDNQYKHIYMFEPGSVQKNECKNKAKELDRCTLIEKGVWSHSTTLQFVESGEGSRIDDKNGEISLVETVSLDDYFENEKVTYIKMDIEGAELNALRGAEDIIRKNKPKLAISIYHRRCDIWEIPKLLLQYNSAYKFYLRIYSFTGNDAILYAI